LLNPTWSSISRLDFITGNVTFAGASFTNEFCDSSHSVCEQEWSFSLLDAISPPVCNFNGEWNLTFYVRCFDADISSCPIALNDDGVPESMSLISFILTTENFCPSIFADITVSASMQSYQDANYMYETNDFLLDTTVYFRVNVISPQATIYSVSIAIIKSNNTHTIYESPTNHIPTVNVPAPSVPNPAGVLYFDIRLTDEFFPVIQDGSSSVTISVLLNVVFENTASNKRHVMSLPLSVDNSNNNNPNTNVPADASHSFTISPSLSTSNSMSLFASKSFFILVLGIIMFF